MSEDPMTMSDSNILARKKSLISMLLVLLLAPALLFGGNAFADGHGSSGHNYFNDGVGHNGEGHGNYGAVTVILNLHPSECTLAATDSSKCTTFTAIGEVVGVYGWGHPRGSVTLTATGPDSSTFNPDCGSVQPEDDHHEGDSRDDASNFSCTFDARKFLTEGAYDVVATYTPDPNRSDDDGDNNYFSGIATSEPFTVHPGGTPQIVSPAAVSSGPAIANITAAPVIPAVPGGTTGSATVTWTDLNTDGVTGYTVTSDPGGFTCDVASATATSCVVSGLSTNVQYVFKVTAHLAGGNSTVGTSNSIMINALLAVTVHNNLKLIVSNFAPGSAQLTSYMKMQIATYASDLLKFGAKTASLVGYTDPSASTAYNLSLGLRRAAAVQAYLVYEFNLLKMPFTPVVTCASKGKAAPRATNTSALGRALNRRVEVVATF